MDIERLTNSLVMVLARQVAMQEGLRFKEAFARLSHDGEWVKAFGEHFQMTIGGFYRRFFWDLAQGWTCCRWLCFGSRIFGLSGYGVYVAHATCWGCKWW